MKRRIRKFLEDNRNSEYSHLLVCFDLDDYECFLRPVKYNEDIKEIVKFLSSNKVNIQAIYNFNLDIIDQLLEDNPYHIEPITKNINNKIKEAYDFATKVHYNQKRRDNTPYISHPIRVAENVRKYINSNNKNDLIICAYLHDTLEDGDITYNDIVDRFGIKIANIVLELTNDNVIKNELGKTRYLQLKMNNMSNDALCVKLCDRLDNIKDLVNADKTFQYKYLIETKSIIDYILNNRKLTDTHLVIIKEIKSEMAKYKTSYKAKVKRLSNA